MIKDFNIIKGDVDTAISIMREVAAWGRSIGLNVWKDEHLTRERLMANAKEEDFYVGKVSGNNACCMILQWSDTFFWPNSKENEAGYIHKLCVRREYAGKGLSGKMVEFAKEECKRRNIRYLRLDTGWDNEKLCNLYSGIGFKIVDKFIFDNGSAMALFEMEIE